MNSSIKTAALKACRHFMLPIARFLLRNGIGFTEFSEISKLAFVQVASSDYGIRGRPTNMSRISVMTGLNRKEIRKLRDRLDVEDWEPDPSLSKPVSILAQWFTAQRYLDASGLPKPLAFEADEGESFIGLTREIGGDVPPGAMLTELIRAGCVEEVSPGIWRAMKRQYSPSGIDLFQVQRFGECLHDLADTISTNMMLAEPRKRLFEFRAWSDRVDPKEIQKLRKIVSSQGEVYLESIDDWLEAHQIQDDLSSEEGPLRCGVGVYYFETTERKWTPDE